MEEIVGSALHRTRRELGNHPIDIRPLTDLPLIFVDGLLLEQVFVNLLENAAHYTPPGTKIVIAATAQGKWLLVSVSDNGPGLVPGTEERIFEKFYRSSAAADSGRGSGLGLAICQAIAQAHGGKITASNRPAGGAEFIFRLPLIKGAPQIAIE